VALLDYTTYGDIRAVLGVSEDEIEDSTLSLQVYEFGLSSEIRAVSRSLVSDVATVIAKEESTRTATESELLEVMTLFSTYAVARQLLTSLPLFSPKEISDGKASQTRYSINPYEETIRRVETEFNRFKAELEEVYASYKSTTAQARVERTYILVSSPSTDPVTGI
jgi:uncharacterized protein (UPF0335 family)